jgi:hypothetical protein
MGTPSTSDFTLVIFAKGDGEVVEKRWRFEEKDGLTGVKGQRGKVVASR